MSTIDSPEPQARENLCEHLTKLLKYHQRLQMLEEAELPGWLGSLTLQQIPELDEAEFELEDGLLQQGICDELETLLEDTKHRWYVSMFSREFDQVLDGWRVRNEPSPRDSLRDLLANSIAAFLRYFMHGLPPSFVGSSKLLAEIVLIVEELGGTQAVLNEPNIQQLAVRLSRRGITINGTQQNRVLLLLAYILRPFEYYLRGVVRCSIKQLVPIVLLSTTYNLKAMVNRNESVLRLRVRAICKLDVVKARRSVLDREKIEVQINLQHTYVQEPQVMGVCCRIEGHCRSNTEVFMHQSYCKRLLDDILVTEAARQQAVPPVMLHRQPGIAIIGYISLEKAKRIDRCLRYYLPQELLWESTNDIFAFRLRNKSDIFPAPELMVLQQGARLPVTVCYYNCVLLNLGDGPMDITVTPAESFGDMQKQMFVELHQPINRCNFWFDSAWCAARKLPASRLRLRAGEILVLPIGSTYCVSVVRDCYLMTWSFVGCSLDCLKQVMSLVDKTGDYKRKEVLLEALARYRRIRERKCPLLTNEVEDPDQAEEHEILLDYVQMVLDHLQA